MLDGDTRRIALAHAILLALPGVPVMRYGDEIGMGDDLSLPERYAVRTPMQWSAAPNGGFSRAARDDLPVKPVASGRFRYQRINVETALRHPGRCCIGYAIWYWRARNILNRDPPFSPYPKATRCWACLSQRIAGGTDAGELQPAGGRGPAPAAGRGLLEPNSGR
jgi:hypothetical protein